MGGMPPYNGYKILFKDLLCPGLFKGLYRSTRLVLKITPEIGLLPLIWNSGGGGGEGGSPGKDWQVDFMVLPKTKGNFRYLLVMVDTFTG